MSRPFKSIEEERRHGLAVLVRNAVGLTGDHTIHSPPRPTLQQTTVLEKHPFELEIQRPPELGWLGVIEFVGVVGATDISVKHMCFWIADKLFIRGSLTNKVNYLRVILAERDPARHDHHDVYFEIGTAQAVLMCGGCTDFSGQGSHGKIDLGAVFSFLSNFYGVAVETVEVPYDMAITGRQLVEAEAEAAHEGRS